MYMAGIRFDTYQYRYDERSGKRSGRLPAPSRSFLALHGVCYAVNLWSPIVVFHGRLHSQELRTCMYAKKYNAPFVGSQPWRASSAADLSVCVTLAFQNQPF